MYQLIKDGVLLEEQEKLQWVKWQRFNGIMEICDSEEGQAILGGGMVYNEEEGEEIFQPLNACVYNVVGKPLIKDYEVVEIIEI